MNKMLWVPLLLGLAACSRSTDTPVNSAAGGGRQEVQLTADGLTTGSRGLHHANVIPFGAPRGDVVRQLTAIHGRPKLGRNAECPNGPVDYASFGGLDLHFQDDRFVGWVAERESGPSFETYRGLSVGDRRSEIDGDSEVSVQAESSLGTELTIDGVGAIFSGGGGNDRVTTLFSGVTCFAR